MSVEKLAVVSDIHGNRWALQAVLDDIAHRGITAIANLGDSLYGPLDPAGTALILAGLSIPTVAGNEDRIVVEPPDGTWTDAAVSYVRSSISAECLSWLEQLERTAVAFGDFFLCHGTPLRDDEYLLHEVRRDGVFPRREEEIAAMVASVDQPAILCGHDHTPWTVRLRDGPLIVNPGSVGLPAYRDDVPFEHVMETGTPHARYAVVLRGDRGWRVEHRAVPYHYERAASRAIENGREDWAGWLRTGTASR